MPTITEPESFPTHRFAYFYKSERYAFASGLTVNPVHLPFVLERMEDDGWELCSVFGGPGAENLCFLFRREENV